MADAASPGLWMGRLATALLVAGALATGAQGTEVYRWVDDDAVIHYSTGLESVPERYRPSARALPVSAASAPPAEPARTGATTVPIEAGPAIRVSARINGAGPVTLLLDTGAERTLVSPAALARLGLLAASLGRAEIRGVTGASEAALVPVESIEVGDARAGPLLLVAHDAGLVEADGLLGWDFLSRFALTIDVRAGRLTLEPH